MKQTLHLKAPANWMNDPNGFIYYKGKYHLFYQHFPFAPVWGTMHWGHAVSEDLVHWEHVGVALFPTIESDRNGCFSGSAVEHDGKMYLYYTGVHYDKASPENIHLALDDKFTSTQLMICSKDGFSFDNFHGKKVVVPPIADSKIGDWTHTRDPKVWRGRDAWYMVLGTKTEERTGKILFYKSEDLEHWSYVNCVSKDERFGSMWECPDYFETEGGEVLMLSPMGLSDDKMHYAEHAICMGAAFDEDNCTMEISDSYQFVDYGLDLYAPQSTVDAEGRRVIVGWIRMPEAVTRKDGVTFRGMFALPRIVEVKDNHIYFRVHPNVEKAFTKQIQDISEADEAGYRVSFDLADGESVDIGGYRIFRKGETICTDRSEVFPENGDYRMQFATPALREGYHLDVYVDENLVEVFVNNGEYVISNAVYGLKKEVLAHCRGELRVATLG